MPVDSLAFANVLFNSLIFLSSGIVCAFLMMDTFFDRRHAPVLFFAYFLLKMLVVALFDALSFFGISGQDLQTFGEVLIALFGAGAYLMVYYTWDAGVAKLGLISIATDLLAGLAMVLVVSFFSWACDVDAFQYIGYIDFLTFAQPVLIVATFLVLMQLLKPVFRAIAQHDFKHEWAFTVLIFSNILFGATSRITVGRDEALWFFAGPLALAVCVLPVLILFMSSEWRRVRRQREYLARSKAIMAACDAELRSQSFFLENSRAMLDGLRKRIEQVEVGGARDDLRVHLHALLSTCDRLRFGTYSDIPALDVVLLDYEKRFEGLGLRAKYRIAPLDSDGERVALAAQALLDWAYRVCVRSARIADKRNRTFEVAPTVDFRVFRRVNQLFFEARVSVGGGRVPYMRASDKLPMVGTVVRKWSESGTLGMRLLLEEGGA